MSHQLFSRCCTVPVRTGHDYSKTRVGTFLFFLVLFVGTGAARGQTGDRLTYQHRRSKHASWYQNMKSSHRHAAGTSRKEPGSVRERRWSRPAAEIYNFPVISKPNVTTSSRRINTCVDVLNSRHSWTLPCTVQRWASLSICRVIIQSVSQNTVCIFNGVFPMEMTCLYFLILQRPQSDHQAFLPLAVNTHLSFTCCWHACTGWHSSHYDLDRLHIFCVRAHVHLMQR